MSEAIKIGWYVRNNGSQALVHVVGTHESGDALYNGGFDESEPHRYHPYEFSKEFVEVSEEYVNSIERHCCPSRPINAVFKQNPTKENLNPDRWDKNEFGMRRCSYCGSLNPDDLIELIRLKGLNIVEPTTKDYKLYVNNGPGQYYKYYHPHSSEDMIAQYNKLVDEHNNQIKENKQNK